jgi:hypothetical protein
VVLTPAGIVTENVEAETASAPTAICRWCEVRAADAGAVTMVMVEARIASTKAT